MDRQVPTYTMTATYHETGPTALRVVAQGEVENNVIALTEDVSRSELNRSPFLPQIVLQNLMNSMHDRLCRETETEWVRGKTLVHVVSWSTEQGD